jgi:alpha-beta hydrolase superfamily lysophospholipase
MPIINHAYLQQTIQARSYPVPNSTTTVVILTGMEEHSLRYEAFALYLNTQGCSVYVFDHIGQGLNAASTADLGQWPEGTFEWTVDALGQFMKQNLNGQRIHFIGHSLGSFVGQRLIQKYSSLLSHVVFIGTNHQDLMAPIGRLLTSLFTNKKNRNKKAPFFNSLAFGKYAKMIQPRQTEFDWLSVNPTNVKTYMQDPYCGYVSTFGFWKELLHGLHHLFDVQSLQRIRKDLPILVISGAQDPVGDFGRGPQKVVTMYQSQQLTHVSLKLYPGLRHEILHEEKPQIIYEDILQFIKS